MGFLVIKTEAKEGTIIFWFDQSIQTVKYSPGHCKKKSHCKGSKFGPVIIRFAFESLFRKAKCIVQNYIPSVLIDLMLGEKREVFQSNKHRTELQPVY